ncbi:EscN/YscN/HrcN family type III secretion system ATPase [Aliidongia dinghuensis]|uniref:EscN/YscN/HrcN family type III secretion system ATPase n=1 Tax=Aliidongia dinghuensis TaxID=1867774 RepID=A0A8J3E3B8_9PROT|nr:FliI/YscN family ATPase [Aliidongia dinghuensis]GGF05358.1 EscN/YscN/HrcN family type III secretion system ATPase [Aliidongia dinghuensis]
MSEAVRHLEPRPLLGRVARAVGTTIEATLADVRVGEVCTLRNPHAEVIGQAEVVGIADGKAILTPLGPVAGLSTRTEVVPTGASLAIEAGPNLLGRVLDGLGRPIDGAEIAPHPADRACPIDGAAPSPLARRPVDQIMPLGIRAIDGLLTCAEGQRFGIYGEPGTGKSSLLAQIVRGAAVDVIVMALLGERGREVREFVDSRLGERRRQTVVVAATADRPAAERTKAAGVATAIAEYFRDEGRRVLLVVDSLTRYARALREIGLAAGEPPARRGFTPSVFAALPNLLERAGPGAAGSITAFYTVLVEGDGTNDPIAEETRAILDGHIVLSNALAQADHFPAIDILRSRSRLAHAVAAPAHHRQAGRLRMLIDRHAEIELILRIGEYRHGSDALADEAIARKPAIDRFLRQRPEETTDWPALEAALGEILTGEVLK